MCWCAVKKLLTYFLSFLLTYFSVACGFLVTRDRESHSWTFFPKLDTPLHTSRNVALEWNRRRENSKVSHRFNYRRMLIIWLNQPAVSRHIARSEAVRFAGAVGARNAIDVGVAVSPSQAVIGDEVKSGEALMFASWSEKDINKRYI